MELFLAISRVLLKEPPNVTVEYIGVLGPMQTRGAGPKARSSFLAAPLLVANHSKKSIGLPRQRSGTMIADPGGIEFRPLSEMIGLVAGGAVGNVPIMDGRGDVGIDEPSTCSSSSLACFSRWSRAVLIPSGSQQLHIARK